MPESSVATADIDLIGQLQAIADAQMRRGVRCPACDLLLVTVLGILSRCKSRRDLKRFAIRLYTMLTEARSVERRRPPSD